MPRGLLSLGTGVILTVTGRENARLPLPSEVAGGGIGNKVTQHRIRGSCERGKRDPVRSERMEGVMRSGGSKTAVVMVTSGSSS